MPIDKADNFAFARYETLHTPRAAYENLHGKLAQ